MAAPSVRAVGAKQAGLSAITPVAPASHVAGDIEYLIVESDNGTTCSLSTAAGFAAVTSGQAVVGTGPSTSSATVTLFWRRWNGTDGNPTVADTGNHTTGFIVAIQNAIASGTPHEAVTTSTDSTADNSGSATGGTSSVADTLVLIAAATAGPDADADPGANFSGWTNAALTSITEQFEYSTSQGNGGACVLTTGVKASAGAIGSTTFTTATNTQKAMVTLAVLPTVGAQLVTPGVASLATSAFAPTIAHQINGASPTALTLTTFAPVIGTTVTPGVATLSTSRFAPVIGLTVIPPVASLTTATFAPQLKSQVTPGVASLTTSTFAPVLNTTVTPAVGSLTLSTFAPTISTPQTVTPGVASLTTTRFAPVLNRSVIPPVASLTLTAFAPTVSTPVVVTAGVSSLTTSRFAPVLGLAVIVPPVKSPVVTTTDAFTRTVATGLGGAWIFDSGDESVISVDGSKAIVAPGSSNDYHIGSSLADAELDVLITFGDNSAPGGVNQVWLGLDAASFRFITFRPNAGGSSLFLKASRDEIDLGAHTPGTQYHLRGRFVGMQVQAKTWVVGDPEPDWQVTGTADAATAGPASLKIGSDLADNFLDDFQAAELRDPALTSTAPIIGGGVVPATASLTTSGFAPTVVLPQTVTPTTAPLSTATFAPSAAVSDNQLSTPGTASLTTTGLAPSVAATAHQVVTPDPAALTITLEAPSVTVGDAKVAQPGVASLTLTAFAPTVTSVQDTRVEPDFNTLTLSRFAPTVTATAHQVVIPAVASLTTTRFAPDVSGTVPQLVTPGTAHLGLTTYRPTIRQPGQRPPRAKALGLKAKDRLPNPIRVVPGPLHLTLTPYPPVIERVNLNEERDLILAGIL